MNISLMHFLQTGTLGQLQLGLSAQEVVDILGPPDSGDITFQDEKTGSYWQYGNFMLSFGNEINQLEGLASIEWIPELGEPRLTPSCNIEDWAITADMTPSEVKSYLREAGLKFHYRSSKSRGYLNLRKPDGQREAVRVTVGLTLFLPSDVRISFVADSLQYIGIFGFLR